MRNKKKNNGIATVVVALMGAVCAIIIYDGTSNNWGMSRAINERFFGIEIPFLSEGDITETGETAERIQNDSKTAVSSEIETINPEKDDKKPEKQSSRELPIAKKQDENRNESEIADLDYEDKDYAIIVNPEDQSGVEGLDNPEIIEEPSVEIKEESDNTLVPINVRPAYIHPTHLLDTVALSPASTGSTGIDAYLGQVIAQITTPQMSTHDKVVAIYNYLINHTRYDGNISRTDAGGIISYPDDFRNVYSDGFIYGYSTLLSGRGVCDTYSCAFSALCRYIGLNSYVIGGQTSRAGGGYTGHAWSVININGTEYIFDAQLDDQFAGGGAINYSRFCKTYDQVPGAYIPERICYEYMSPLYGNEGTPAGYNNTTVTTKTNNSILLSDGTIFDPDYYARTYPDVYTALGGDPTTLLNHYLNFGRHEGRRPNGS